MQGFFNNLNIWGYGIGRPIGKNRIPIQIHTIRTVWSGTSNASAEIPLLMSFAKYFWKIIMRIRVDSVAVAVVYLPIYCAPPSPAHTKSPFSTYKSQLINFAAQCIHGEDYMSNARDSREDS